MYFWLEKVQGIAHYTFFSPLRYEKKVYWALRGFPTCIK